MHRAIIKNLHPFYKPDDDGDVDINDLLFGGSSPSLSSEDAFAVPEIEGLDSLTGDDLDAALAALLAADGESSPLAPVQPAPELESDDEPESSAPAAPAPATEAPPAPAQEIPAATEAPEESADEPQGLGGGADIDALLNALGGGDDTESLSGAAPGQPDDMLSRMLAADEKADSNLELKDTNIAPNITVLDEDEWSEFHFDPGTPGGVGGGTAAEAFASGGLSRPRSAPRRRKKKVPLKKRLAAMSVPKFVAASFLILVLILGSGAGVIFGIRHVYAARLETALASAHLIPVTQPGYMANYSLFIPVNEVAVVGDSRFFLRRMTVGQRGTLLHFDDVFDPADYSIVLLDQDGNFHMRIAGDFEYDLAAYPDRRGTVLQFAPVSSETEELTLYIQEPTTGEVAGFYFTFGDEPVLPAIVHVNFQMPLIEDVGDRFVIADAVFSNTGSEIVYLSRLDPLLGAIVFDWDGLRMREGARTPFANRPTPTEFIFPEHNRMLGRITYGPVRNLEVGVFLNFSDVYVSYPVPRGFVDIPALFRDEEQYQQRIPLGSHTLVLERMGAQGPFVILVFHGLDEYGQRVQTEIVADLVIQTDSGPIVIRGQNFFSPREVGTDLFFDTRDHGLDVIRASDMRLDVSAVQVRVAEATVNFYLEDHDQLPHPQREAVEEAIRNAFDTRLAYRSGIHGFPAISGFTSDVLNNQAVMRHYTPITVPGAEVMFDSHILAGAFAYENVFLAVVEEEWVLEYGGIFTSTRNTHQVIARLVEDSWVIVSNRVVS